MTLSSHQRPHHGATDIWLTPPEIVKAVGPFDLDPCAAVDQPWITADFQWTVEDDGLAQDWTMGWPEGGFLRPFVWCNPPFGNIAKVWLERMAKHNHGIALVPARTETSWFVDFIWNEARAILFLHGRPHFHHPDGTRGKANSGAPICLVAYGEYATERLLTAPLKGSYVEGWKETSDAR